MPPAAPHWTSRTRADFAACLREATDAELPPAARAARAYLDVAFFHPFSDGNARAALLPLLSVYSTAGDGGRVRGDATATARALRPGCHARLLCSFRARIAARWSRPWNVRQTSNGALEDAERGYR
ncbi:Fic family protein [Streptomyces sp. NPDC004270]